MIHFRCHRCKRQIAVPEGYVGKKVKCPACSIVTIVPDIPGAKEAKARETAKAAPPPPPPPAPPPMPADPLDQLAAAAAGEEVYEAYDSEQYGYGPQPSLGEDAYDRIARLKRKPNTGLLFFILLIVGLVMGAAGGHLVYYLNARLQIDRERLANPNISSQINYGNAPHFEAMIWGVVAGVVVAILIGWLISATRTRRRR